MDRSGDHMHLWEKHFKTWIREAYSEKGEPPPKPSK